MSEDLTLKTEAELRAISDAGKRADGELNRRWREVAVATQKRVEKYDTFKKEELRFALTSCCKCGAKLAYPKTVGGDGAWSCSAILMRTTPAAKEPGSVEHSGNFPFMYYEIKSEPE